MWRKRWLPVLPSFNSPPPHSTKTQVNSVPTQYPLRRHRAPSCACPVSSPPRPRLSEASCSLLALPLCRPLLQGQGWPQPSAGQHNNLSIRLHWQARQLPAPNGASTPIRRLMEMRHSAGPLFLITPSRTLETGRPLPGLPVGCWLSSS